MLEKEKREHYYYVTYVGGVTIFKAFNKKSLRKSHNVLDKDIIARFRHYENAYKFAQARCDYISATMRPRYVSITGNDVID